MPSLLSLFRFGALVGLPGAWLTFVPCLAGFGFLPRLLTGVALAPAVVLVQFYAFRLCGASFATTAMILPIVNLPVLYWVRKHISRPSWPGWRRVLLTALVLVLPAIFLWIQYRDPAVRAYTGHTWLQTDIIYQFANGNLLPEDSDVAGIALGYPWATHIYQAVVSYDLGGAPLATYPWTNLVCLAVITGLLLALVDALGGGFTAKLASISLLFFGVNFAGYVLQHFVLPPAAVQAYAVWGNDRYTPWIFYFFFFTMVPYAMAIFGSLALVCVNRLHQPVTADFAALAAVLVSALGVLYSLVAPATWVLFGIFALWVLWDRYRTSHRFPIGLFLLFSAILLAAGLTTLGYQAILTKDRIGTGLVAITGLRRFAAKSIEAFLIFLPVWTAVVFLLPDLWRKRRAETLLLLGGGMVNCLLYALFVVNTLDWAHVEYKFIMCAAVVLTPFAGLLVETSIASRRWAAGPVVLGLTILLALPFAHKMKENWPWTKYWGPNFNYSGSGGPALDVRDFTLRLAAEDPRSRFFDAVREMTPVNTVVVVSESPGLEMPTLLRRALYVAPYDPNGKPGLAGAVDGFLFGTKGYHKELVAERRETVHRLYCTHDETDRQSALFEVEKLDRPVAIIADRHKDTELIDWLQHGHARELYEVNDSTLWLVDVHPHPRHHKS